MALGLVFALVAGAVWPASADPPEKLASGCTENERFAWANYTQAQTFRPEASEIVRAEARLLFFEPYEGAITARLVLRPPVDAGGYGGPGITVAEMATEVRADANRAYWIFHPRPARRCHDHRSAAGERVQPRGRLSGRRVPGPSPYLVRVDECAGDAEGRGYHVSGATQVARVLEDGDLSSPAVTHGVARSPVSGPYQVHHEVADFQYRVVGR